MEEYIKYGADIIELDINGEKVRKNIEDYIQDEMAELESIIGNLEKMIGDEKEKEYVDLSFQNKNKREKMIQEIKEKKEIIEENVKYAESQIMDYIANKRKEYPLLEPQDLVKGITQERFEKLKGIVANFDEYKKATEEKIENLEAESKKLPKTVYEKNKQEMVEFIKNILEEEIKKEADIDAEKKNCKWEKRTYEVATGEEVLFVSDKFGKIEDILKKKLEEKYGEKLGVLRESFLEDVQILPAYSRAIEGAIGKEVVNDYQGHDVEEFRFPKPEIHSYEEMNLLERNGCKEKISEIETIKNSQDPKYDEPGYIDVHVNFKVPGVRLNDYEIVRIPMTQRELAKAGFSPEPFGWKGNAKVSSKDIVMLGKNLSEILIKSVKDFFDKALQKGNTAKGEVTEDGEKTDFGDN